MSQNYLKISSVSENWSTIFSFQVRLNADMNIKLYAMYHAVLLHVFYYIKLFIIFNIL